MLYIKDETSPICFNNTKLTFVYLWFYVMYSLFVLKLYYVVYTYSSVGGGASGVCVVFAIALIILTEQLISQRLKRSHHIHSLFAILCWL